MFAVTRFRLGGIALLILALVCAAAPAQAAAAEITSLNGPEISTNDTTPTFTFTADEANVTFECSDDLAPFAVCSSPHDMPQLAPGTHMFAVRATGPGSGTGTAASRSFTVDTTPPETTIDDGPGATNEAAPTFYFSSNEIDASFECRVDADVFESCPSPYTTQSLDEGPHTFYVRATDVGGNVDATPESRPFTIDFTPPDTTIVTGPSGATPILRPAYTFSSSETGSTFECRVDAAAFAACTSPYTSPSLAEGPHTIEVRAVDAAGNPDETPATRSITIVNIPDEPPSDDGSGDGGGGGGEPDVQARVLRRLTLAASRRHLKNGAALKLTGSLKSNVGRSKCQAKQKIAIQRRKPSGGRFQTFEVAVTATSGSFKMSTRPARSYIYRAKVNQTVRCMGATSKTAKVVIRKRS